MLGQPGSFIAGVPVQPIVLDFGQTKVSWEMSGIVCLPINILECQLQTLLGSQKRRSEWKLFRY